MSEDRHEIAVLGAGITGLAAAYYLEKVGADYVVLERDLHPGGLCRSIRKDGFTFDYTGHVLWRMDPETLLFYQELLGDNLAWIDRKSSIWIYERLVPYPFQTHLKALPPPAVYECLSGFLERDRWLCGVDFESWSRSRFGDGIHRHFMAPFNEKLYGVPLRELTWDGCTDIPIPKLDEILRGAILGQTFVQKGNAKFGYPKVGGMQALVDALLKRIPPERIMTGRTAETVDVGTHIVCHRDWAGNPNSVHYDRLISTIPLKKLLKIMAPADPGVRAWASHLRANAVACVMLGFERGFEHPVHGSLSGGSLRWDVHWLYVPDPEYPFYRLGFPYNVMDTAAPPGRGSVTAEITIPPDMSVSDDELKDSVVRGLEKMGLLQESNRLLTSHVVYIAPAYVIFDLARRKVPDILAGLRTMGIYAIGRYGAWSYCSVSDNVAEARVVAKEALRT